MSALERINVFLAIIKSEGRSSPAGRYWHDFWEWLEIKASNKADKPPKPLILAAAGASHANKYIRLREQLLFADMNGFGLEAVEWLAELAPENWNHGSKSNWHIAHDD